MTNAEIEQARRLCAAAGPGPWKLSEEMGFGEYEVEGVTTLGDGRRGVHIPCRAYGLADATFIAASRTLLPAVLDEIEMLRAALKEACALGVYLAGFAAAIDSGSAHAVENFEKLEKLVKGTP
jgi:hypothetical protein